MNTYKLFRYCGVLLAGIVLWGCAKHQSTEPVTNTINEQHPVFQQLIKAGFSKKSIAEYPDRFVAEGDLVFYKKEPIAQGEHMTEQARAPFLVSAAFANVTIYLNVGSFGLIGTNLSNALNTAIASYNSIGSNLQFTRVFSSAGAAIQIVRNDLIGAGVCGQAGLPFSNGQPFNIISINELDLLTAGGSTVNQLTKLVTHEIGHCIGLRHTNWQALSETPAAPNIGGTPLTDVNSVMNGGYCGTTWVGFSGFDITAVRTLYTTTNLGNVLNANTQMLTNQFLRSADGRFTLYLQPDGNLVLYWINTVLWQTGTLNQAVNRLVMQGDGNLVLYDSFNGVYFQSGTSGFPGAYLILQNDGNLVIVQNGIPRWQSGTCCH